MSNRETRNRLADGIEAYLESEIDNDELFDILWSDFVCNENTCREIVEKMDLYLDEFHGHYNQGKYRIGNAGEQAVRRWIALLRSDWEWPKGRSDTTPRNTRSAVWSLLRGLFAGDRNRLSKHWPFNSDEEWNSLLGNTKGEAVSESTCRGD